MNSLLYRVDDKTQDLDRTVGFLADNVAQELETTKEAMGVLMAKLNEIVVHCVMESIQDIVNGMGADEEMEEIERSGEEKETIGQLDEEQSSSDNETEKTPMPAGENSSLRGMGNP